VPNSFSAGTTIESSAVNANFSDIASEITNSLPRDGQAAMTGAMKASNGTAAAPSITFGSDTDTGLYRSAANTMNYTSGGVDRGELFYLPSGTTMLFVQTSAPTGWTKSTTHDNKALRIVSGTASSGGTTAFTTVFAARTLVEANLPSHTHTFSATTSSNGDHSHTVAISQSAAANAGAGVAGSGTGPISTSTTGAHTHTLSGTTGATGSATAVDFAVQYVDAIIAVRD
jgi:hypothetical protein